MRPTTGASGCIAWPDPDLERFPCGSTIDDDALERWEPVATQMMFAESGLRFPGVECDALVRVRGIRGCGGAGSEADLSLAIPYPIVEVLEVLVDGEASEEFLPNYWVRSARWLVVDEGATWGTDDRRRRPGAAGTTMFRVRYGREPDEVLVKARDELLWNLVMSNEPPKGNPHVRTEEGVTTLSENGRTITFEDGGDSKLLAWARKAYPRRTQHKTKIYDLAEEYYSATVEIVLEDE